MRRRRRRRKRRKKGRRRRRKKTIPKPYTSYYVRKKPTRCDKLLNFIHSTCFGHQYAHHQEYKPGSCLCCEVLAVVLCALLLYCVHCCCIVCTAVVLCVLLLYCVHCCCIVCTAVVLCVLLFYCVY